MALSQWKEAILEGIFTEISEGLVEEKNLERLENLVEILHKEGSKVPESVKQSYCQVAVECTARCLEDSEEAYTEAIRSIWLRRVMPLCDKVSCLVTRELLNSCKRLWTARSDDKALEALNCEDTREKALASLRKVVTELHPGIDCGYGERDEDMDESDESISEESGDTEPMEEDKGRHSDNEEEEERSSGALEAESPPRRMKTISTPVYVKALEELRAAKIDLMNALAEGRGEPSNLNVTSITEQETVVANPVATSKPSLMERRDTAQTLEWEDSIDDSVEERDDDGEVNNKARGKKIVVSPFKRDQRGGGRRPIIPWSTAETLAVMRGYEKYGANWKRIKDECPILVRRTNGDLKDKYRVEMRRQERHRLRT